MAISTVRAQVNGTWHTLTYNSSSGSYTATITAPGQTSFNQSGGYYIKLLDWLEETGRNYPIRIHSMNPVGAANMRRIINRNGWEEVK